MSVLLMAIIFQATLGQQQYTILNFFNKQPNRILSFYANLGNGMSTGIGELIQIR